MKYLLLMRGQNQSGLATQARNAQKPLSNDVNEFLQRKPLPAFAKVIEQEDNTLEYIIMTYGPGDYDFPYEASDANTRASVLTLKIDKKEFRDSHPRLKDYKPSQLKDKDYLGDLEAIINNHFNSKKGPQLFLREHVDDVYGDDPLMAMIKLEEANQRSLTFSIVLEEKI